MLNNKTKEMFNSGHKFYNKKTLMYIYIAVGVIGLFSFIVAFLIVIIEAIPDSSLSFSLFEFQYHPSIKIQTRDKMIENLISASEELKTIVKKYHKSVVDKDKLDLWKQYLTQLKSDMQELFEKLNKQHKNINWRQSIIDSLQWSCAFQVFIIPLIITLIIFLCNYNKKFKKKTFYYIFITSIILLIIILIAMCYCIKSLIATVNEKEKLQKDVIPAMLELEKYLRDIDEAAKIITI